MVNRYDMVSHNPYFNRWFSAINATYFNMYVGFEVKILILIDGFLQYHDWSTKS